MAENMHLADLWVAVVPDTSKIGPALEEAGKKGKTSFREGIRDIGRDIGDEFKNVGQHAKDAFKKVGKEAGEVLSSEIGRELQTSIGKTIGEELGRAVGDAVKDIPGVQTAAKVLQEVASNSKVAQEALGHLGTALKGIKSDDPSQVLSGMSNTLQTLSPLAEKFGLDIKGWPDALNRVRAGAEADGGALKDLASSLKGASDGLAVFDKNAGGIEGKLGKLGGKAGEVAKSVNGLVNALNALSDPKLQDDLQHLPGMDFLENLFQNWPEQAGKWLGDKLGTPKIPVDPRLGGAPSSPDQRTPGSSNDGMLGGGGNFAPPDYHPAPGMPSYTWIEGKGYVPGEHGVPAPSSGSSAGRPAIPLPKKPIPGWGGGGGAPAPAPAPSPAPAPAPSPAPAASGGSVGGAARSSIPTPTDRASVAAAGSSIANLYAFAESLQGTPYSTELRNDCSGLISEIAAVAVGLPPPSAGQRFSTPNEGEWLFSHGFKPGMGGPGDLRIGWNPAPGQAGHTAGTLPSGENIEQGGSVGSFRIGGPVGADSSQFTMHAYLPMSGAAGSGTGKTPTGTAEDPIHTTTKDKSTSETEAEQLGHGLVNGILQEFGLDGSIFKGFGSGKSPLQFGALKLATGLMNYVGSAGKPKEGDTAAGGDGGNALAGLGQAISAGASAALGIQQSNGDTIHVHGDYQPMNVTQNNTDSAGVDEWKQQYNAYMANNAAPAGIS